MVQYFCPCHSPKTVLYNKLASACHILVVAQKGTEYKSKVSRTLDKQAELTWAFWLFPRMVTKEKKKMHFGVFPGRRDPLSNQVILN